MSDAKTSAVLFWKNLFASMYQLDATNTNILAVYVIGVTEIENAPTVDLINYTLSLGMGDSGFMLFL